MPSHGNGSCQFRQPSFKFHLYTYDPDSTGRKRVKGELQWLPGPPEMSKGNARVQCEVCCRLQIFGGARVKNVHEFYKTLGNLKIEHIKP